MVDDSKIEHINIYDAGPAIFDYSKGTPDRFVAREHQQLADEITDSLNKDKLVLRDLKQVFKKYSLKIDMHFPWKSDFVRHKDEANIKHSLRIANSRLRELRKCDAVVADVSAWPEQRHNTPPCPMADEGTIVEIARIAEFNQTIKDLINMAEADKHLYNVVRQIIDEKGLPKPIILYAEESLYSDRMKEWFGGKLQEYDGSLFSYDWNTMVENWHDPNSCMVMHIAREQGHDKIEKSLEAAIKLAATEVLEMRQKLDKYTFIEETETDY